MKITLRALTLLSLSFGFVTHAFATQAPVQTDTTILDRIPSPYQVAHYTYLTANVAAWGLVLYVGYKAYTNENLSKAVTTLYNLATVGDTVTAQKRQEIKEKKAKKDKDITDTAEHVKNNTTLLETLNLRTFSLEDTLNALQTASADFATKKDLEGLATKDDIQKLHAKLDTLLEQTRSTALAQGFFAGRKRFKNNQN